MAIETKTIVTCICDRCGAQEDKKERDKKNGAYLNVAWKGSKWGRTMFGDLGGIALDGASYLCEKCTNDFLEFMGKK